MVARKEKEKNSLNVFRMLRIARDVKVKDLADTLGVTPGYVNLIEKGEKLPSLSLLYAYADALKVPAELLISFRPDGHKPEKFERTMLKLLKLIIHDKEDDEE